MAENNPTLEEIQNALGAAGDPWEAGETSLSALSPEEQRMHLGLTPPPGERTAEETARRSAEMQAQIRAEALAAVGAPTAYDLRDVGGQNFVTPIKDQSFCGSCVAFGAVATVESTLRVQRKDPNLPVNLSEAHLFFCHGPASGASCSTGWWPKEAFDDFRVKGVADEACYPYELSNTDCSDLCKDWAMRVVRITEYTALTNNPAKIKEWVSTKGAVCACFDVYEDFYSYKTGVYRHVTGDLSGGHCVTIVGYDDGQGCWICKNSWGTGWGEQGFFRIAYGECGIDNWYNHGVLVRGEAETKTTIAAFHNSASRTRIRINTAKDPEAEGNAIELVPHEAKSTTRLVIPQCKDADEFNENHLQVHAAPADSGPPFAWKLQYVVWVDNSDGATVRYSTGRYSPQATPAPGKLDVGGLNALRISQEGNLIRMRFYPGTIFPFP